MCSRSNYSLWKNLSCSCYFLIPNNQELPNGEFVLYTFSNDRKKTNLTAIEAFEITEEEAVAHLQNELHGALEQTKVAFSNLVNFSLQASQSSSNQSDASSQQIQTIEDLISALSGVSWQEFQQHPEPVQAAALNLFNELKALIIESTSKDPAANEAAHLRLRLLRERLQTQGVSLAEDIDELSQQIQESLSSVEGERSLKAISAKLRSIADKLESPDAVEQVIDEVVASLNDDLPNENTAAQEDQQRQEYRSLAQNAIAESFRNLGLASFAGGDLQQEDSKQAEASKSQQ